MKQDTGKPIRKNAAFWIILLIMLIICLMGYCFIRFVIFLVKWATSETPDNGGEDMEGMKEVSIHRYSEVMCSNDGRTFQIELTPLQVGMLHGAIRLMFLHPDVEGYSFDFHVEAEKLRSVLLSFFRDMGFTDGEIEYLDSEFA